MFAPQPIEKVLYVCLYGHSILGIGIGNSVSDGDGNGASDVVSDVVGNVIGDAFGSSVFDGVLNPPSVVVALARLANGLLLC